MKNKSSVFAVLGLLYLKSMSGYEIKKLSLQTIHYFWNCNFGDIYPILRILLSSGYILKTDKSIGKKKRAIYTITTEGRLAFNEWLFERHDMEDKRIPFLLKIFFSGANHNAFKTHLTNFLQEQQQKLGGLKSVEHGLSNLFNQDTLDQHAQYIRLCISFGINATSANINWVQDVLSKI